MEGSGKQKIVILLGTNFSGSHLLSHLLSAHPRCLGVGEIHRFEQLLATGSDAPVVSDYNSDPLFAGLVDVPVNRWHGVLGSRYAERFGVNDPVVVDNSKKVEWVERIAGNPDNEIRFVHLIRDPRALVLRWSKTYTSARLQRRQRLRVAKRTPSRAFGILTGNMEAAYIYKWLRENRRITRYLSERGRVSSMVTYHDMVFDTQNMLHRLMPVLGLEFDPAQLRFGESNRFGTTKTAHAESLQRSEIRPDVKWQIELSAESRARIEANADVGRYLEEAGLRFGPDGLIQ